MFSNHSNTINCKNQNILYAMTLLCTSETAAISLATIKIKGCLASFITKRYQITKNEENR